MYLNLELYLIGLIIVSIFSIFYSFCLSMLSEHIQKSKYSKLSLVGLSSLCLFFGYAILLTLLNTPDNYNRIIGLDGFVYFQNFPYAVSIDGMSALFLFLTVFLIFLSIVFVFCEEKFVEICFYLFLIQFFLITVFTTTNVLYFYIFFEAILIPMYLLIVVGGSRERKIRASYLFFYYTLCGSIPLLCSILYIYSQVGSFDLKYIVTYNFSLTEELFLWFAFFFSFASKIPMFPFHIWLPEAHVEAPTVGSVLLAGILLKLGVYGFIRYSLFLFPKASLYFTPLVYVLSLLGILYASLTALRQTDIKRIIAYSSIAHMNLVTLGIFSYNSIGIEGAIMQSVSHGFVSGGLFFIIGILYNRYHSRFVYYYGGLVHTMPLYSFAFLVLTMANIALPGTSSFVGEFMLLCGVYIYSPLTAIVATLGVILSGAYSLWLYNKLIFGNLKENHTLVYEDLHMREFFITISLIFCVILIGVYPNLILNLLYPTLSEIILM